MQRGLVGSEMCIRDRYQRRVHGEFRNMVSLFGWMFTCCKSTKNVEENNNELKVSEKPSKEEIGDKGNTSNTNKMHCLGESDPKDGKGFAEEEFAYEPAVVKKISKKKEKKIESKPSDQQVPLEEDVAVHIDQKSQVNIRGKAQDVMKVAKYLRGEI
eukprot:TRINITY_DN51899_c0_g1_i2.p1 TRINITY_DN51899_c0_g1~~TRINITY_DN51899_c0_g1_i2.p1  ORF type:complete len:157 (-),score=48.99 TRINITY_DN51899_c0_g1_i2:43-513(-)